MARPWLSNIDKSKRILEIGPLHRPNISKTDGESVYYADIRSTGDIKDFYKNDPEIDPQLVVDVDYVVKDTYTKSLQGVECFDYIVMTHVIEHIPDLISFFSDIVNVLKPDGKICLSIPDKRYCFDRFRTPTSFAEVYENYIEKTTTSPRQVLDFLALTRPDIPIMNNPVHWRENQENFDLLEEFIDMDCNFAISHYNIAKTGTYIDGHFSVFTPASFLLLCFFMTKYSLFPFKVTEFYETEAKEQEFDCVLEKSTQMLTDKEEQKRALKHIIQLLNSCNNNDYSKEQIAEMKEYNEVLSQQLAGIYESETWKIGNKIARVFRIYKPSK